MKLIAKNEDTITSFKRSLFPLYLLPFLNLDSSTKENEQLKLSSLSVFFSLANSSKIEIVKFFADEELLSIFLKTLKEGSKISILVMVCILKIILSKEEIMEYICGNENLLINVKLFLIIFNYFLSFS